MKAIVALLALTFAALPLAAQKVLIRTVCVRANCATADRVAPYVAPTFPAGSANGILLVDGEDPIARCFEHPERTEPFDAATCVNNRLGLREAAAMKEQGWDGYFVQVLAQKKGDSQVYGSGTLLTPAGQRARTPVTYLLIQPNGMYYGRIDEAPASAPILMDFGALSETAARLGLPGLPPHRDLVYFKDETQSGGWRGWALVDPSAH